MKKNKKEVSSPYMYFTRSEETVYRTDETQKQEIFKRLKRRKFKKRALNVISFVLAFAVLVSGSYVGKKGIEKFLVLRQEEKLAVVLGTEGDGLAAVTIEDCDYTVKIPMYHGVDSLNVAAASAVAFWVLSQPASRR